MRYSGCPVSVIVFVSTRRPATVAGVRKEVLRYVLAVYTSIDSRGAVFRRAANTCVLHLMNKTIVFLRRHSWRYLGGMFKTIARASACAQRKPIYVTRRTLAMCKAAQEVCGRNFGRPHFINADSHKIVHDAFDSTPLLMCSP